MVRLIRNWYQAKKAQMELKALFYNAITALAQNRKGIMELAQNLYTALKDIPAEELQEKLMEQIAIMAHEPNNTGD